MMIFVFDDPDLLCSLLWIDKVSVKDKTHKTKTEESTRLVYTGLIGELEHLKIETTLIDEMFPSVMCEYVFCLFIMNQ